MTGTGADEIAALHALDDRLRGSGMPPGRVDQLRARLRLAFVEGADEWAQRELGRALSSDELARVTGRYSGW